MPLSQGAQQALAGATQQQINALNAALVPQIENLMRNHMGNLIRKVIAATPPYASHGGVGTGGQAKGLATGTKNIRSDLKKVFSTVRSVPFRQLVMNRDWEAMAAYGMQFKNPALEQAFRDKKIGPLEQAFTRKYATMANIDAYIQETDMSQVYARYRKNGVLKPPTAQKFLVKNKGVIDNRARDMARGIGKMVGGWHMAAAQLKIPGIGKSPLPGLAAGSGEMKSSVDRSGGKFSITATNAYGDFANILSSKVDCQKLINDTAHDLEMDVQMLVEHEVNRLLQTGQSSPKPPPQPPRLNPASQGRGKPAPQPPRLNTGGGGKKP